MYNVYLLVVDWYITKADISADVCLSVYLSIYLYFFLL